MGRIRKFIHIIKYSFCKKKYVYEREKMFSCTESIFLKKNKQIWNNSTKNANGKNEYVLVEGHLGEEGPNYLIRTAIIAKEIEKKEGVIPLVLTGAHKHYSNGKCLLYGSFAINKFICKYLSLKDFIVDNLKAYYFAFKILYKVKSGEDLLKLSIDETIFGDLIYDDIIKNEGLLTLEKIDKKYLNYFYRAFYCYFFYQRIFEKFNIKYLVSTHTMYIEYGFLVRVALIHETKVFETNDNILLYYNGKDDTRYFMQAIKNLLIPNVKELKKVFDLYKSRIDQLIARRIEGKIDQIDVKNAFGNKKTYTREDLKHSLKIDNDKPIVFIFSHVFKDAPHLTDCLLYRDYYEWFVSTIKIIKDIKSVNWIIKQHPSAILYGEDKAINSIVSSFASENLFFSPDDLNTNSIIQCADAILTVQGTIGVEASCLGIPVITAGNAFYSDLGFTYDPKSEDEYVAMLKNIKTIEKLSEEQVKTAKIVFFIYQMSSSFQEEIIGYEALEYVWGYNKKKNLDKAYEEVIKRMNNMKNNNILLLRMVREYIDKGFTECLWKS